MAYVNVAEWSADQIADWLKGLDCVLLQYIPLFLSNEIKGHNLLNLRADDLENLGVYSIGHQELILEAVGQLRNFHYELDRENLQHLALKLSCVATSLFNELKYHQDISKAETQTLSDVTNVIATVKPLVCWLDRSPFSGQPDYAEKKAKLLRLSIAMATSAQRDRFAEFPLLVIREICSELALLADIIIQEVSDPMILQPATLDLATLKKREQELGFDILPSCSGIHQVTDIKFGSPAHSSGKIEDGDEIVQVNYQTVVGWQAREVLILCQESPADVLLTLKKRPRHTHTYGQIYMKPYRLPSRKRSTPYNRWGSLPSPRPELLSIRNFEMPLPRPVPVPIPPPPLDLEASSSDESESTTPGSPTSDHISSQQRIYLPKPRSVVQRRNTTSGSSPVSKRPNISIEQFWRELKNHKSLHHTGSAQMSCTNDTDDISDNLCRRDKSVSCSTGLELCPRPKTCLGVGLNHSKVIKLKEKLNNANKSSSNEAKTSSKTVKFCDQAIQVHESRKKSSEEVIVKETRERGKLDKSHSTPAYDFGESDDGDFPLMKEVIPESPTLSIDSPSIVIHTSEKIDQILSFKKSSEQITDAMNHQNREKHKINNGDLSRSANTENIYGENILNSNKSQDKAGQILETINIALLEHRRKEVFNTNKSLNKTRNIFETEFGDSDSKNTEIDMSEKIETIQNELLEAINEQKKLAFEKSSESNSPICKLDVPPEPPPRPPSTQKPGYIPPKHMKHIQKEDIQVIPNKELAPSIASPRKDIPLNTIPISPGSSSITSLSIEAKHSANNLSNTELSSPRTPLMPSRSLQILEPNQKPISQTSNLGTNRLDPSISCLKSSDPKSSVSPGNSMVRGLLSAGKSKSLKKKNSILAKRRKVSVKDLGSGDMEGHLFQRCRSKNNSNVNWQSRWFILIGNTFYGFKQKDSSKADCLIFLSGFTVSVAKEINSKQFAFKVYHTGTAFYFASDSADSMAAWVESITRATLTNNDSWERASKKDKKTDESKHFSETDYSDEEIQEAGNFLWDRNKLDKLYKIDKFHKFSSLKKFTIKKIQKIDIQDTENHSSTSLDRKYLRFFSSKSSKNKEEKSKLKNTDVPVPTDRYRSYRKIPFSNVPDSSQTSPKQISPLSKIPQLLQDDLTDKNFQNIAKIKKIESIDSEKHLSDDDNLPDLTQKYQKKFPDPINYIHASYPNLLDFETSDFVAKPKSNAPFMKNMVQRPDNLIGFVTLEQLMLNKQEEERRQVYSNRVLMGIERDSRAEEKNLLKKQERSQRDNNLQKQLDKIIPDVIYGEIPTFLEKTPTKMEQIQSRSLPKTPQGNSKTSKTSSDAITSPGIVEHKGEKLLHEKNMSQKSSSKKINDGYETIKYDEIEDSKLKNDKINSPIPIPPKILRKPSFQNTKDVGTKMTGDTTEPDKCSLSTAKDNYRSAKDLGYEFLYDDESSSTVSSTTDQFTSVKDLGYEVIYTDSPTKSNKIVAVDENRALKKLSGDSRKPVPPPKLNHKPKPVSRQSSVTSVGDKKSGIDTKPVFKQGDSPEKFWLDSLRRNDKVYTNKQDVSACVKADKFYTKHSEPFTYMKSSEATIVKSDKLQNKTTIHESTRMISSSDHKPLKSATQYTPMSLPNKTLKTTPQFELSLDSRELPATTSGISRLRQIFQHGGGAVSQKNSSNPAPLKEKTLLGSPRLHRAIFRKHHNAAPPDEWAQDFVYSKGAPPVLYTDNSSTTDSYLFSVPSSTSVSSCDVATNLNTPDYPHLEYPPVFEPETYSLVDPGPSILRKINHNDKK